MKKIDIIIEVLPDEEYLQADGFDDAIIGVCEDKLVYSKYKCIEILKKNDNMTEEDALEYFHFNVENAMFGDKTPIWVEDRMFYDT